MAHDPDDTYRDDAACWPADRAVHRQPRKKRLNRRHAAKAGSKTPKFDCSDPAAKGANEAAERQSETPNRVDFFYRIAFLIALVAAAYLAHVSPICSLAMTRICHDCMVASSVRPAKGRAERS
jgi:hypothetical protein